MKARILNAYEPDAIAEAAEVIRRGGLVAFPTETVYGLGADACDSAAVARIFEVKRRPTLDPLIVHVADPQMATEYGVFPEPLATELLRHFWPGPLTLVVRKTQIVPPIVTAGLATVGIRVPAHPAALDLIRAAGTALAAPSANPFGYVSPTEARHVFDQLSDDIDLILDGGPCPVGLESTILSLDGRPCLLRAGGVTVEELEGVVGPVQWPEPEMDRPSAPGQLLRHYATHTKLDIVDPREERARPRPGERVGLLTLTQPANPQEYAAVEVLSEVGDLREAAAKLFSALRRLDRQGLDRLVASPLPEKGLGLAIMDRLRRCSSR